METSLHRELKLLYAGQQARFEVPVDGYRVDAISRGRLIEIQHGSLAAIRDKVQCLLAEHRVCVVKPLAVPSKYALAICDFWPGLVAGFDNLTGVTSPGAFAGWCACGGLVHAIEYL